MQEFTPSWIISLGFGVMMILKILMRCKIGPCDSFYNVGVNRFIPTHTLYRELACCMTHYRRLVTIVRLWHRLVSMPEDRLVKLILCWDWEICPNNWCADVKEIFEELEVKIDLMKCVQLILTCFKIG